MNSPLQALHPLWLLMDSFVTDVISADAFWENPKQLWVFVSRVLPEPIRIREQQRTGTVFLFIERAGGFKMY